MANAHHVKVVPTHHWMADTAARLCQHAPHRGAGYVLLLADDLGTEDATASALEALAILSPGAWRAYATARRGGP